MTFQHIADEPCRYGSSTKKQPNTRQPRGSAQEITPAFENLQWMSVLKSLTAYQMYRREVRLRIRRSDVLKFLLLEVKFPRSLCYAFKQVEHCINALPNPHAALIEIKKVEKHLHEANPQLLIQDKLHEFIDDMQTGIITIFNEVEATYF